VDDAVIDEIAVLEERVLRRTLTGTGVRLAATMVASAFRSRNVREPWNATKYSCPIFELERPDVRVRAWRCASSGSSTPPCTCRRWYRGCPSRWPRWPNSWTPACRTGRGPSWPQPRRCGWPAVAVAQVDDSVAGGDDRQHRLGDVVAELFRFPHLQGIAGRVERSISVLKLVDFGTRTPLRRQSTEIAQL
jgi:hypothetical protein